MGKILVVEDDQDIREMIADYLQDSFGHEVTQAQDGANAFEVAGQQKFDTILTDLSMPKMNGIELCSNVRADSVNKDTPIVVVSGDLDMARVEKIKRLSVAHILHKPVDMNTLADLVENLARKEIPESDYLQMSGYFSLLQASWEKVVRILDLGTVEWAERKSEPAEMKEVVASGVIPVFGNHYYGSLAICFTEPSLQTVAKAVFHSECSMLLETILPVASEMANQIAAGLVSESRKRSITQSIGLPYLGTGKNHKPRHLISGTVHSQSFKVKGANGWIEFVQGNEQLNGGYTISVEEAS